MQTRDSLGGDAIDLRHHAAHRLALPHDVVAADAPAELAVLLFQPRQRAARCSTVSSSLSVDSGFSRKSTAPRRVARTAMSIVACPEIMMTGVADADVAKFGEHREAVLARHHDVGEDEVEALVPEERDGARGVVADDGLVARRAGRRATSDASVDAVIVHDQDASHFASSTAPGSSM